MNFLSGLAKSGQPKPTSDEPTNEEKPTSNADLFASAKVVAEAAQAQFSNDPGSYDKAKASGAAADLLDAAAEYGKLDESQGAGKYVEQAEGYLRQYGTPASADHKAPPPAAETGEAIPAAQTAATTETAAATETTVDTEAAEKPSAGAAAEAGGAGEYLKKAEEVVEKPAGDGGEKKEAEGGYGDLMRAAGGFLNK